MEQAPEKPLTHIKLINPTTNETIFQSDSVWGIIGLILLNWGSDPNFKLDYHQDTNEVKIYEHVYLLSV